MSSTTTPGSLRRGLHDWFHRIPGRLVLDAEARIFHESLRTLFGYHLLQVGRVGEVDLLSGSRVLQQVVVEVDDFAVFHESSGMAGVPDALPVASDSIDVVVLPHVLEYVAHPHDALREVERVLVPEGHLVVSGFNPLSMFGVWRLVRGRQTATAPWRGQFLSVTKLKDWLALLGFDVVTVRSFFFRPPFRSEGLMRRLLPLEVAGEHLWSYLGGAYVIVAKKRVTTLTPIKPRWAHRRRLVAVGIAEPSTRVAGAERLPAIDRGAA